MLLMLTILVMLVAAILMDLLTVALVVRRNIAGEGPSGVPVIPWFLYLICTLLIPASFGTKTGMLVLLTGLSVVSGHPCPETAGKNGCGSGGGPLHETVKATGGRL